MGLVNYFVPHSFVEILLFIIMTSIFFIFIKLLEYTDIQKKIKMYSRCYKNAALSSVRANEYMIIGYSAKNNIEIARITYDFKHKNSSIEITAPAGSVINKTEFKLYNLKTYEVDTVDKTFTSTENFNLLENDMIYVGHPELVRFMQFGTTDFFEKILFADSQ